MRSSVVVAESHRKRAEAQERFRNTAAASWRHVGSAGATPPKEQAMHATDLITLDRPTADLAGVGDTPGDIEYASWIRLLRTRWA